MPKIALGVAGGGGTREKKLIQEGRGERWGMGHRKRRQPTTRKARGREGGRECEPLAWLSHLLTSSPAAADHYLPAQAASTSKQRDGKFSRVPVRTG
jgi:hypothetical protein